MSNETNTYHESCSGCSMQWNYPRINVFATVCQELPSNQCFCYGLPVCESKMIPFRRFWCTQCWKHTEIGAPTHTTGTVWPTHSMRTYMCFQCILTRTCVYYLTFLINACVPQKSAYFLKCLNTDKWSCKWLLFTLGPHIFRITGMDIPTNIHSWR